MAFLVFGGLGVLGIWVWIALDLSWFGIWGGKVGHLVKAGVESMTIGESWCGKSEY